jgi:hypothetical protein
MLGTPSPLVDTDAIVVDQSISLEQALSADVLHGTAADARRATVVVGSDWPFDVRIPGTAAALGVVLGGPRSAT